MIPPNQHGWILETGFDDVTEAGAWLQSRQQGDANANKGVDDP